MVVGAAPNSISSKRPRSATLLSLALVLALSSCASVATRKGFYEPITADLRAQEYDAAVQKIEAAADKNRYSEKDRLLYYLDSGLAHHYAAYQRISNERLSLAEETGEELFTKSVSRAAASLLLNDNVLEYSGEDYEILYTNLVKALNYLAMDQFDDAFVEIRRSNEKLDLLEQKYDAAGKTFQEGAKGDTAGVAIDYRAARVRFENDAFARYLSMHLYAADGLFDDAQIDRRKLEEAYRTQPHVYPFQLPDVRYSTPRTPVLSVVALAGLSPTKEALNLRIRTDKDLNLVQVLYTDGKREGQEYGHIFLPIDVDYYFKFSIPQIVSRPSAVRTVRLSADSRRIGELRLLEDVGLVAAETFEARKSLIYLRAVGRAVFKGLLGEKLKKKAEGEKTKRKKKSKKGKRDGSSEKEGARRNDMGARFGTWLQKVAVDVAMEVSESADLRCSELLPGKVLVGDFEIEPGIYDLRIDFIGAGGRILESKEFPRYEVEGGGRLNLIEAVYLN